VPEQHDELARDGNGRDLMAAARTVPLVEGAHRAGGADRDKGGLSRNPASGITARSAATNVRATVAMRSSGVTLRILFL
jgi:hypothetical protein